MPTETKYTIHPGGWSTNSSQDLVVSLNCMISHWNSLKYSSSYQDLILGRNNSNLKKFRSSKYSMNHFETKSHILFSSEKSIRYSSNQIILNKNIPNHIIQIPSLQYHMIRDLKFLRIFS